MTSIDVNADLGEGFGVWTLGDDFGLLDLVTSANVACGFHGGDPAIMRRVCAGAAARGVRIGAQVGYRDLAGFGRRAMDVASDELEADVIYQIGALDAFARIAGDRVRYVKPHGALYNTAAVDDRQAAAVIAAVAAYAPTLPVLGLPGSALERAAAARSVPFVGEAFADRAYTADGRLRPRAEPGSVLTDPAAVIAQALRLSTSGAAGGGGGGDAAGAAGRAQSLCVHGDTDGAVALARQVRTALADAGVDVRAFS